MRRVMGAVLAGCMVVAAMPAGAADFDVVQFWRTHPAGAVMESDDASAKAPGNFSAGLAFVHVASSAGASRAEVELLKRRLQVAFDALMSQPSLKDPHGSTVMAGVNISRIQTENGPGALSAELQIIARPIRLDDAETRRTPAGRYLTPGEGVTVKVTLNPSSYLGSADILGGTEIPGGVRLVHGSNPVILLTEQPLPAGWTGESLSRRWERDSAWTSVQGTGEAPMLVYLGASRQVNEQLDRGTLRPTSNYGRIVAATRMINWTEVRRQMLAVR